VAVERLAGRERPPGPGGERDAERPPLRRLPRVAGAERLALCAAERQLLLAYPLAGHVELRR
jgi:hypothetical protein